MVSQVILQKQLSNFAIYIITKYHFNYGSGDNESPGNICKRSGYGGNNEFLLLVNVTKGRVKCEGQQTMLISDWSLRIMVNSDWFLGTM